MERAFRIWLWTTLFLVLYGGAAYISSTLVDASVRLEAGHRTTVKVVRLADDPLQMALDFSENNNIRPELGFWEIAKPWPASNEKRYLRPGAAIKLRASAGSQSVDYEAVPAGGYGARSRELTSQPSIGPGTWHWPPPLDLPKLILDAGVTTLSIEVLSVEEPLVGASARLVIYPPISFKRSKKNPGWVAILWFGIPLLLLFPVQLAWGLLLLLLTER